jgi:hypothetical protein
MHDGGGDTERDAMGRSLSVPGWFRGVAALCVAWNLLGAADFTLINLRWEPYLALQPPATMAFVTHLPGWVVAAWGLGVWGSLAGAVLMAARVRHAAVAYGLSFAGAVASMTWEYSHDAAALGGGFAPMAGVVLGAILVQAWFSRRMFWRGILR